MNVGVAREERRREKEKVYEREEGGIEKEGGGGMKNDIKFIQFHVGFEKLDEVGVFGGAKDGEFVDDDVNLLNEEGRNERNERWREGKRNKNK